METEIVLLPEPRSLRLGEGRFIPRGRQFIRIVAARPWELMPAAAAVQHAIENRTGERWDLVSGGGEEGVGVCLSLGGNTPAQGYKLLISDRRAEIVAHDPAGAFYGAQTLVQLFRLHPEAIPTLEIEDWPDFPNRGFMLDISRDKVPTMETLYELVDLLAQLKINQLQLYTEHTFAYRRHPEVWEHASPMTGEQILQLGHYCRERFIELVPNQNAFGHMERWLKLPRYRGLAESAEGFVDPWGMRRNYAYSLCPLDPQSLSLVEGLFDELLPHFSSDQFNVGCDETWDLGQGRSREQCQRRGTERVYLDFLLKIHQAVRERGRRMQFWGDIIIHKPELISELPRDIIALEWGYEADHPFDRDGEMFRKAGVPFYVCPGTSSWLSCSGRSDNAIANLKNAAENGLKHGASGYLITDWGDHGHLQYLPVSYLGLAAGAAYSWCFERNRELSLVDALDHHIFHDAACRMGSFVLDFGNVYQHVRKKRAHCSILFWALAGGPERRKEVDGVSLNELSACESAIDSACSRLQQAHMRRTDGQLIVEEFRNAAAMLRHACRRGRWLLHAETGRPESLARELNGIIVEHGRLWLARNRPGGLQDSIARLEQRVAEYHSIRPESVTFSGRRHLKSGLEALVRLILLLQGVIPMLIMSFAMGCDRPVQSAGEQPAAASKPATQSAQTATAVFAGGCFWCTEAVFEELDGVKEVVSGYAGGTRETANYERVSEGNTGHAEAIRITYDPAKVSFDQLLDIFFTTHDPTTKDRQGPDRGHQYRSAVFYSDQAQKAAAEAYIRKLEAAKRFDKPIVTTVEPLDAFYPAEQYHQDFVKRNPNHPYILRWATPKVEKVREKFKDQVKPTDKP